MGWVPGPPEVLGSGDTEVWQIHSQLTGHPPDSTLLTA